MSDQKLNNRELLNVRWAFDDPNPKARKEVSTFSVSKKHVKLVSVNFLDLYNDLASSVQTKREIYRE